MELERLFQKQIRSLQLCVAFLAIAVLVLVATAFDRSERHDDVLRVRGLVIEDAQGRERILIGAPIPEAKNRVRTDLVRVKSAWAGRFPSPDQYIQSYKAYRNDMNGILILDADGFDRVAVGDPIPDPNVGRRISPSSGLVINDEKGFERSGYGLLKVDNRHRVVLGMDDTQGKEGLTLFLIDSGPVGLDVNDGSNHRSFGIGTQ